MVKINISLGLIEQKEKQTNRLMLILTVCRLHAENNFTHCTANGVGEKECVHLVVDKVKFVLNLIILESQRWTGLFFCPQTSAPL